MKTSQNQPNLCVS